MILEVGFEAATNADILSGTRLNAIPYGGLLTLMFQSNLNDGTNSYRLTIQLPNGDVPVDSQLIPACNPALPGVLDERTLLKMAFPATQGGHFNISTTEAGTAVCSWMAVLSP